MISVYLLLFSELFNFQIENHQNYLDYHKDIIRAEALISNEDYGQALDVLEGVFSSYDFIFLRDYKVAAQLALLEDNEDKTLKYLKLGISRGWEIKDIKKNHFLKPIFTNPEWKIIESQYESARSSYLRSINESLRAQVHEMFRQDQRKALGALFRIGNKAQERYGLKKFAPHSELQMTKLDDILNRFGYPGEKVIGNNLRVAVIVSHHNSISYDYVISDTIYQYLKPKFPEAIINGEMSPYEFALMEDWKTAVETYHSSTTYGYLGTIETKELVNIINQNRAAIGLRSVAIRNALVDIEATTGMDLYLPGKPWQVGKITTTAKRE